MKLAVLLIIVLATVATGAVVTDSLTIGAFTIDATGSPSLTVKPPTRAGTLAITADIPTATPVNMVAGQATLAGGSVTVTFTALSAPPVCVATDVTAASSVRRSAVTAASVTFEGVTNHVIEYICTAKSN